VEGLQGENITYRLRIPYGFSSGYGGHRDQTDLWPKAFVPSGFRIPKEVINPASGSYSGVWKEAQPRSGLVPKAARVQ
jgi:hypothetical protein